MGMKGNSIRTTLPRLTRLMIVILILLLLPANVGFQLYLSHYQQRERSSQSFDQLRQLMQINEMDLKQKYDAHISLCLQKAEMASYYAAHVPEVITDLTQTRELADKIDVDEINFLDKNGDIFAGTNPESYGLSIRYGEQMQFFLPMLDDTSLKLCQDLSPNTADGALMQYAAVWMEDESCIVQIGMRQERLIRKLQEKSLQQLVSSIPFDYQGYLHIYDTQTRQIVASSIPQVVGKSFHDFDVRVRHIPFYKNVVRITYNGEEFCTYMEPYNNYLLVRTYLVKHTVYDVMISTLLLLSYILFSAIGVIGVIVWYINKHISKNLTMLIQELKKVEDGDLNGIALNTGVQEFDELILDINQILKSIELSWGRLSHLIDTSRIPLGIFEYNKFYKKTFMNPWMMSILGIEDDPSVPPTEMRQRIHEKLTQAENCCVDPKEEICKYYRNGEETYLRLRKHIDEQSITYYALDVSSWWKEIHTLRDESNRDQLTGLYNRRGMGERLDELFCNGKAMGKAAFVMLDADGLKHINDVFGHEAGDEYLKAISRILTSAPQEHSVCVRLGGDEFLLLLYGYDSYQEIESRLAQIKGMRGTPFWCKQLKEEEEKLEFSMGYSYYPADGQDYHLLMRLADEKMYLEKKGRKDCRS